MMYALPTTEHTNIKLNEAKNAILALSGMAINHGTIKEVFDKSVPFASRLEFFIKFMLDAEQ